SINQDIDAPKLLCRGCGQSFGIFWLVKISFDYQRSLASGMLNVLGQFAQQANAAGRDSHMHTFSRQTLGNGAAYALAGAGDESGLSSEMQVHDVSPLGQKRDHPSLNETLLLSMDGRVNGVPADPVGGMPRPWHP